MILTSETIEAIKAASFLEGYASGLHDGGLLALHTVAVWMTEDGAEDDGLKVYPEIIQFEL